MFLEQELKLSFHIRDYTPIYLAQGLTPFCFWECRNTRKDENNKTHDDLMGFARCEGNCFSHAKAKALRDLNLEIQRFKQIMSPKKLACFSYNLLIRRMIHIFYAHDFI